MSKLLIGWAMLFILSMGCLGNGGDEVVTTSPQVTAAPTTSPPTTSPPETPEPEIIIPEWMDTELTDLITGETFKIRDFKGKPMLFINFNTLLTQTLKQQQAMKEIKDSQGDSIVLISINLDLSDDKRSIGGFVKKHGFGWYFVLPPPGMKDDLVDDFGLDIINPEKVPVVLICNDLSSRILEQGVKSADILLSEIDSGC
jgi:hypothetical protein